MDTVNFDGTKSRGSWQGTTSFSNVLLLPDFPELRIKISFVWVLMRRNENVQKSNRTQVRNHVVVAQVFQMFFKFTFTLSPDPFLNFQGSGVLHGTFGT